LASGGPDTTVRLWDVSTGKERATLQGHRGAVSSVVYAPDGKTLASASGDLTAWTSTPGEVKLWDATTGKERASLEGHKGGIGCVTFAPDSKTLATASGDGT